MKVVQTARGDEDSPRKLRTVWRIERRTIDRPVPPVEYGVLPPDVRELQGPEPLEGMVRYRYRAEVFREQVQKPLRLFRAGSADFTFGDDVED